jgi:hypothetical protein
MKLTGGLDSRHEIDSCRRHRSSSHRRHHRCANNPPRSIRRLSQRQSHRLHETSLLILTATRDRNERCTRQRDARWGLASAQGGWHAGLP